MFARSSSGLQWAVVLSPGPLTAGIMGQGLMTQGLGLRLKNVNVLPPWEWDARPGAL